MTSILASPVAVNRQFWHDHSVPWSYGHFFIDFALLKLAMKVANSDQVTTGQCVHLNCELVAKHPNHEGMLDEWTLSEDYLYLFLLFDKTLVS